MVELVLRATTSDLENGSDAAFAEPDLGELEQTARHIASVQTRNGAIPWEPGGRLDPWNHVEATMGLTVMGFSAQARGALEFLAAVQRPDGAWYAQYDANAIPTVRYVDTNFVAYVATGTWHYAVATHDTNFLIRMWPVVKSAIDFVVDRQEPSGHIQWAVSEDGRAYADALVTGSASTFLSLRCAIEIAIFLNEDPTRWVRSRQALGRALSSGRGFDRTWPSKRRFAMDWFYPVLCGVLPAQAEAIHLNARWDEFADLKYGCRCVCDRDWRTAAETAELVMACHRARDKARARALFATLAQFRAPDGSYWTGLAHPERELWPEERTTWTAGAVLLAADSVYGLTPSAQIFDRARCLSAS